ncbi:sterol carrier protein [Alkalihalophilus pseudofirmus]|nr:sterol carrier protein [Alkalihalophilus pseudofirmus]
MAVKETLEQLQEKMNNEPEGIQSLQTTYQFDLTGEDEGTYQIKFENAHVEYVVGEVFEPKCTLALSDSNFLKLVGGKLNPTMAFMSGKLKIKGDMGLALKLQNVLKNYQ